MPTIYARLIEVGILVIAAFIFYAVLEVKRNRKFKKQEKEWLENSFEWHGMKYNKNFFDVIDGEVVYKGDNKQI